MSFLPSYFFDFSNFPHTEVFDLEAPVWLALTKIKAYLKSLALGKIDGRVSPQAYLIDPQLISIGEGSVVEPGAYIQGPCLIGKNCTVRHGAYIRGNLIAGDNCVIGHGSEVKNAIFMEEAHAAHFAYVGDSILGKGVNLGAGTRCANFKLNKDLISVQFEGVRIATQLRKFGAILGDGSQIGCNCVTNPGTLIGQEVRCFPCINTGGFIPSKSIVKPEIKINITSY